MNAAADHDVAARTARLIQQTLQAGLEHVGRGMVLVLMHAEGPRRWNVAYVGRTGVSGYERELMDQYDPNHEMVVSFVGPNAVQARSFRLPIPWRLRTDALH
jgi:hypothetical protein